MKTGIEARGALVAPSVRLWMTPDLDVIEGRHAVEVVGRATAAKHAPVWFGALRRLFMAIAASTLCLQAAAPAHAAEPVIIDTDVGDDIDDAFALALAVSDPRLEVLGVTTAWGDTGLRRRLAIGLMTAAGRSDIPVAKGRSTTDTVPFTQAKWAEAVVEPAPGRSAADLIRDQVRKHPGRITLVALAPMSNIADLMATHPEVLRGLKRVVVMGGSIYVGYTGVGAKPAPASAEYNVASQPKPLATLLALGVPVVLFPLDSTQLKFDAALRARVFSTGTPLGRALAQLYEQWKTLNTWAQTTPTLFDAVPVAWLLDPTLCPLTKVRIAVDAEGFTRLAAGSPNVEACLSLGQKAAQNLIVHDLTKDTSLSGPETRP